MALELVGGAVLGVLFDQLRTEIWRVKDNFVMFKPKLEELEETLTVLYPVIEEIEELNRRLNRPNHGRETIILRRLLEDGAKLVSKCSKIPRLNFLKQGRYREKLVELDNKILRFHNIYLQAHMGRDQKQTLLCVQETKQMMIMSLNQLGLSTDSSDLTTASFTGSSNITISLSIFGQSNTIEASSDAFVKQIMVIKVVERDTRRRIKAQKLHLAAPGMESVESVDFLKLLNGKNEAMLTGNDVDTICEMKMRKKICHFQLLSLQNLIPNGGGGGSNGSNGGGDGGGDKEEETSRGRSPEEIVAVGFFAYSVLIPLLSLFPLLEVEIIRGKDYGCVDDERKEIYDILSHEAESTTYSEAQSNVFEIDGSGKKMTMIVLMLILFISILFMFYMSY